MIKLLETPNPALLYTAFLIDHPLLFQEKVRADDADRRKAVAKNLADRHAGQVLGYLLSADSIVPARLLLEQQWVVKPKAVYIRAGLGVTHAVDHSERGTLRIRAYSTPSSYTPPFI